jgi:hypothetical protein
VKKLQLIKKTNDEGDHEGSEKSPGMIDFRTKFRRQLACARFYPTTTGDLKYHDEFSSQYHDVDHRCDEQKTKDV